MKKRKIGKKTLKALLLSITVLVAVLLVASAWGGMVNPHNTHVLPLLTLALPIILVANVGLATGAFGVPYQPFCRRYTTRSKLI